MEPERNGTFAAKPLGESPRNSSHGSILSFLFFLFSGINQCLTVNRIENNSTGSAQVHLAEARGFAPRHYSSSLVIALLILYFSHLYYFIVAITRKEIHLHSKDENGIQPFPASGSPTAGFSLPLKCERRQRVAAYSSSEFPPIKKDTQGVLFYWRKRGENIRTHFFI